VSVVYTSGVWVLGETHGRTDESGSTARPAAAVAWRPAHEQTILRAAGGGLSTAVIRPGIVFGERRGLVSPWFERARNGSGPEVVGDGGNHWSFIHREDLAELYRLVIERRTLGVVHGVDGAMPTVQDAARAAGAAVGSGSVHLVPVAEARKTMGPLADALTLDQQIVSSRGKELGWKPIHRPFTEDAVAAAKEWGG